MVKLCEPKISGAYWVNRITYKCKKCGNVFEIIFENGNELVKFEEINGNEVRWLPTYDKGGYLDLMTKLIGYSSGDEITMAKTKAFIQELNKHCEHGKTGNGFDLSTTKFECPSCKSKDKETLKEDVLTNPKLPWLQISCDLIMEDQ